MTFLRASPSCLLVLGAGNDEEVLEVLRFARDAGFRPRASILHDGSGAMVLDERGKQLMHEVGEIVGKRFTEAGDHRARLVETGRVDFKGSRCPYIDELGNVHWCSQQRGVFPDVPRSALVRDRATSANDRE